MMDRDLEMGPVRLPDMPTRRLVTPHMKAMTR